MGGINFRVRTKIFCSPGNGEAMAIKVASDQLIGLLEDPRFQLAPYLGRYGWVRVRLEPPIDWDEVTVLVQGSYRLIAPRTLAQRV